MMTPETQQALQESIEKWEANATAEKVSDLSWGSSECPLCRIHNNVVTRKERCDGCPIKQSTGQKFCVFTPYEPLEVLIDQASYCNEDEPVTAEMKDLICQEIDFLKSLVSAEQEVAA